MTNFLIKRLYRFIAWLDSGNAYPLIDNCSLCNNLQPLCRMQGYRKGAYECIECRKTHKLNG